MRLYGASGKCLWDGRLSNSATVQQVRLIACQLKVGYYCRLLHEDKEVEGTQKLGDCCSGTDSISLVVVWCRFEFPKHVSTLHRSHFIAVSMTGDVVSLGRRRSGLSRNSGIVFQAPSVLADVQVICSNFGAFAALSSDGSVVCWGHGFFGGGFSRTKVTRIFSNAAAFAALLEDRSVVAWGDPQRGGHVSPDVGQLLAGGVTHVCGTSGAFAALKDNGSVVTWGDIGLGADGSNVRRLIGSGVCMVVGNSGAFAALKEDGRVTWWGTQYQLHGLQILVPSRPRRISHASGHEYIQRDVLRVYSNFFSFACIKTDGSVFTWGASCGRGGADSSSVSLELSSGVLSVSSTSLAFAALKVDGSVITWGAASSGGDSSAVRSSLLGGVVTVVGTRFAFAALKEDGSVVTWGDASAGGDSSRVSYLLRSDVLRVCSNTRGFAALKTDGSVITWGNLDACEGPQAVGATMLF